MELGSNCKIKIKQESGIVELSGESGTGKTQLCLEIVLSKLAEIKDADDIEDNSYRVIYIGTESAFPIERLASLMKRRGLDRSALDRLLIRQMISDRDTTTAEPLRLFQILEQEVAGILSHNPKISLLIIDSIAAPFRAVDASQITLLQRSELLYNIASLLKYFAFQYGAVQIKLLRNLERYLINYVYSQLWASHGQTW